MTAAISTCRGGDAAAPLWASAEPGAPAPDGGDGEGELAAGVGAAGLAGLTGVGAAPAGLAGAAPAKIEDMMFPNTDIVSTPDAQGVRRLNGSTPCSERRLTTAQDRRARSRGPSGLSPRSALGVTRGAHR